MVEKNYIFDFLRDLKNNNSKEWMDDNRNRYHKMKERWLQEIKQILDRLSRHNDRFSGIDPKKTLSRINNNRRFHPDKPVYKDFVTCSPAGRKQYHKSTFFISIGPTNSFIGGGIYHPKKEDLNLIRDAIDYNGEKLKDILNQNAFKTFYGGLTEYDDKLVTSPQGFSNGHPHIDLINHKSYTAVKGLTENEVLSDNFIDLVEKAYLIFKPMDDYLIEALTMGEAQ